MLTILTPEIVFFNVFCVSSCCVHEFLKKCFIVMALQKREKSQAKATDLK